MFFALISLSGRSMGKVEAYEVEGALDGIIDQIVATCEAE